MVIVAVLNVSSVLQPISLRGTPKIILSIPKKLRSTKNLKARKKWVVSSAIQLLLNYLPENVCLKILRRILVINQLNAQTLVL